MVEHVDASDVELCVLAAEELEYGKADGVGAAGRSRGEDAVGFVVEGWRAEQVEVAGSIKVPDDEEVGETFDVGEAEFELRQNGENTFCVVLCVKAIRDFGALLVRAADESNRPGNKHGKRNLPFMVIILANGRAEALRWRAKCKYQYGVLRCAEKDEQQQMQAATATATAKAALGSVELLGALGNVASGYSTLLGAIAAPEFLDVGQTGYGTHACHNCDEVFGWDGRLA